MIKLWLDDERKAPEGWTWVKNYTQFCQHLDKFGVPDVVAFDHDLGFEHYPLGEQDPTTRINYDSYIEKTGFHCAQYLIEYMLSSKKEPEIVFVHSFNVVGARNIENLLRYYTRVIRRPYDSSKPDPLK